MEHDIELIVTYKVDTYAMVSPDLVAEYVKEALVDHFDDGEFEVSCTKVNGEDYHEYEGWR